MLLTKKSSSMGQSAGRSPFVHNLARGLSQAIPTVDRRAFLRRSGLGVGVGIAACAREEGQSSIRPLDRWQWQDRSQAHGVYALLGRLRD